LYLGDDDSRARAGNQLVKFVAVNLYGHDGTEQKTYQVGTRARIGFTLESEIDVESLVVDLAFTGISGEIVAQCNNYVYPHKISIKANKRLSLSLEIPQLTLNPGTYRISLLVQSENMASVYDWLDKFESISVVGKPATAPQQLQAEWREIQQTTTTNSNLLEKQL
jgi:hypothetical protein